MGVSPENTEKLLNTIPKTYCKKLAGNSICVNVLSKIFENMFIIGHVQPEQSLF